MQVRSILHVAHVGVRRVTLVIVHNGLSESVEGVLVVKHTFTKPFVTVIPATIDRDLDPSKRPPTGGWAMQISDCPHRERFARMHIWNG